MRKGKGFQAEDITQTKARRISEKEQPIQGTVIPGVRRQHVEQRPKCHLMNVDVILRVAGSHGGHWS